MMVSDVPRNDVSPHNPVMLREVLSALSPRENRVYIDATLGAGGYTRAILDAANCSVYGFDRDPNAIADAGPLLSQYQPRLRLMQEPFARMREALAAQQVDSVDGVVMDLGVSSMQLDEADRGFSFMREGPLSMRMDGEKPDAADVVAFASVDEMVAIFKAYGEEKRARVIARAISAAREIAPIETTTQLAKIIEKSVGAGHSKIHPATRVFQALRIFVNDELGQLVAGLKAAERLLRPAGRLIVVTFHSLEDRIVKRFIANRSNTNVGGSRHAPERAPVRPSFVKVHAKASLPHDDEISENSRARSAKLRAASRLPAPVFDDRLETLGAPLLKNLETLERRFAI